MKVVDFKALLEDDDDVYMRSEDADNDNCAGISSDESEEALFDVVESLKAREKATSLLAAVFRNVPYYKQLLSCDEEDAQKILDTFQQRRTLEIMKLLDTENFSDRAQLIAVMRRLSERTKQYPTSFALIGPSPTADDEPVTYGSFADIYKIVFHGEDTCYKVIRVYQRSQVDHLAKVYAREAILWGQLSHPNILPFYGLVRIRSRRLAFVSRWASNGTLDDYLVGHPDAHRLLLCMDTAAGVNYLHDNDIVHGDLKGVNVLIDSAGRACLGDFGLSSVYDPKILRWTSQSSMASRGGTTRWKAPELVGSEDAIEKAYNSKATDVYAWANVCYEVGEGLFLRNTTHSFLQILTGKLPFHDAMNDATVLLNIMQGRTPQKPPADHLAWLKHGLNERVWSLMKDCWSFEPLKRPTMAVVMLRLTVEMPPDLRPPGEWAEKEAVRFRRGNATVLDVDILKDPLQFWQDLETLIRGLVPEINGNETSDE
ncbi:hypothetical protein H0H93_013553 [Arthromyces matolae]|nr:hypothetical protein H0H93_013553 [Arthromyces matolae]